MPASPDTPVYFVRDESLIPVGDYLTHLTPVPPSRMFVIKKGLAAYTQTHPGSPAFDASQGDGGATLPGVPKEILEHANQMQMKRGTGYDMPFGTEAFRKSV